ncbi:MAG: sensor histidine kinase [Actinomycetes bacterium]
MGIGIGRLAVRDWAVAALAVAATWVQVSVGTTPEPHPAVNAVAGLCAVIGAIALAWRRVVPGPSVAVAVAGFALHDVLVGPALPVAGWLAVFAIARHARTLPGALRGAALAAGALAAAELVAGLIHDRIGGVALALMLTLIVLLAASLVRLQADRMAGQRRERDAARQQAVTDERLRIARDLHDLVGHSLSTVAIQSGTARVALDSGDPAAARRAVASIEAASRAALAEMRQLLGVLRHEATDPEPLPGLNGIEALADRARATGHSVIVDWSGPLAAVPPASALAAYRVVQEALTNVVRHAPGSAVHVTLTATSTALAVQVEDSGSGQPPVPGDDRPRYGLVGLTERVAVAGGTVEAGPRSDSAGWRVAARLPIDPAPETAAPGVDPASVPGLESNREVRG